MDLVATLYVPSKDKMIDGLIKALSKDKFREIIDKLGLVDIYSPG